MFEAQGGFAQTELDRIAAQDDARRAWQQRAKARTNKRHGNKGSRRWGVENSDDKRQVNS